MERKTAEFIYLVAYEAMTQAYSNGSADEYAIAHDVFTDVCAMLHAYGYANPSEFIK